MPVRRKAALLLGFALLAGCGTPSTEVQTLPKLTAPAAAVPTAASDATPAGAVAFARFFFERVTLAFATKDPAPVAALSAPGCLTCKRFTDSLTELRDKNERVSPVTFAIRFAEAPSSDGRTARVDVQYDFSGARRYDSAGRLMSEEKPTRRTVTVSLLRRQGSWHVSEIR